MTREEQRRHWRLKVDEFEESGLSASRFCREQDLNYAQLLRWRKKFVELDSPSEPTQYFAELAAPSGISLASGGLKIEVDGEIAFDSLVRVIGALCRAAELPR